MASPYASRGDDYRKATHLFWHPEEVSFGSDPLTARVIFVEGYLIHGAWALPGGRITTSRETAQVAAENMYRIVCQHTFGGVSASVAETGCDRARDQ